MRRGFWRNRPTNKVSCAICGAVRAIADYPGAVCRDCDARALNEQGQPARHASEYPEFVRQAREYHAKTGALLMPDDHGDNPVFIDGLKCWRRYRFGGWVTMRDRFDCATLKEFYERSQKCQQEEHPKTQPGG